MVKIDLITGFLGAGKTTFIKKYAAALMAKGKNIGILENDYGAVNVDMMLLQDLEGDLCELEMVAGGCDYDCHRRRFKTKLIAMGMCGYDRVLVEPSGIFDVDEFFDVLREDPLDQWYEIGNVIAVVDASLEQELSEQSEYLLASQIAGAGCVVISRAQLAKAQEIDATIAHLNAVLDKVHCKRRFSKEDGDIRCDDWFAQDSKLFEEIEQCGYRLESHVKLPIDRDNGFESLYYMNLPITLEELKEKAKLLLQDPSYGNVFRMKGFVKKQGQLSCSLDDEAAVLNTEDVTEQWYELNATQKEIVLHPIKKGQEVLIVIGENLQQQEIEQLLRL